MPGRCCRTSSFYSLQYHHRTSLCPNQNSCQLRQSRPLFDRLILCRLQTVCPANVNPAISKPLAIAAPGILAVLIHIPCAPFTAKSDIIRRNFKAVFNTKPSKEKHHEAVPHFMDSARCAVSLRSRFVAHASTNRKCDRKKDARHPCQLEVPQFGPRVGGRPRDIGRGNSRQSQRLLRRSGGRRSL